MYSARGRSGATAATADHALAALWNPHASIDIEVTEIWVCANAAPGAGAALLVKRISARGTAGSTVTPTIGNDHMRELAPPSGALLDLAVYSVQPTIADAIPLAGWTFSAAAAAGLIIPFPRKIHIPPGAGLALVNATAIIFPASDVTFAWIDPQGSG